MPALYLLCATFMVSCSAHVPMCLNPGARVNALGKLGVRFVKGGHGTDNGEEKKNRTRSRSRIAFSLIFSLKLHSCWRPGIVLHIPADLT